MSNLLQKIRGEQYETQKNKDEIYNIYEIYLSNGIVPEIKI